MFIKLACSTLLLLTVLLQSSALAQPRVISSGEAADSAQAQQAQQLLTAAFKQLGDQLQIKFQPISRSLHQANQGEVIGELVRTGQFHQATGGQYPNLQRVNVALFSRWLGVFTLESQTEIIDFQDVENKRVAFFMGQKNIANLLNVRMDAQNIFAVASERLALQLLLEQVVDVAIVEKSTLQQLQQQDPLWQPITLAYLISETQYYTYLHKKYQPLIHSLEQSLLDILAETQ